MHPTESTAGAGFSGLRCIQLLALGSNRKPHKRWTGWILEDTPEQVVIYRPPQAPILLHDHDPWTAHAPAICLFWPGRYYNLSYLLDAESRLQGYYLSIATPPVRRAGYLEYVDLNLGLVVGPDLAYTVDTEEALTSYPEDVRLPAQTALHQACALVRGRDPLLVPPRRWLDALDATDRDSLDEIARMLR